MAPRQPPELDSLEADDWTQLHPGTLGSAHWDSCELLLGWTGSRWLDSALLPSSDKGLVSCSGRKDTNADGGPWPPAVLLAGKETSFEIQRMPLCNQGLITRKYHPCNIFEQSFIGISLNYFTRCQLLSAIMFYNLYIYINNCND